MARKRKTTSIESSGSPGWMTTFSDLMTLLLTFFILLFSMSSVVESKFDQASASMSLAFTGQDGLLPEETTVVPTNNGDVIILTIPQLTEETRKNYVKQKNFNLIFFGFFYLKWVFTI